MAASDAPLHAKCELCAHYRYNGVRKGYCERVRLALKRVDRGTAARVSDFQVKRTDSCSRFMLADGEL
jgi:hypothetical protein